MNPRVKAVKATDDFQLIITFDNEEVKVFNAEPYLNKGFFKELKDVKKFKEVEPAIGSVQWGGGQDFCPDMLYEDSVPYQVIKKEE